MGRLISIAFFSVCLMTGSLYAQATDYSSKKPARTSSTLDMAEGAAGKGEFNTALMYFQQAFQEAVRYGDVEVQAYTLSTMAEIYRNEIGNNDSALAYYHAALMVHRQMEKKESEVYDLNMLGMTYRDLGQLEDALKKYGEALELAQKNDFKEAEAFALREMGLIYQVTKKYDFALDNFRASLNRHEELGDKKMTALGHIDIGLTLAGKGDSVNSEVELQQGLDLYRAMDDPVETAWRLNSISVFLYKIGRFERAVKYYKELWEFYRKYKDRQGEANALNMLGSCYFELNRIDSAVAVLEKSLAISIEIGDNLNMLNTLTNIGVVYKESARYEKALEYFKRVLKIIDDNGFTTGRAQVVNTIEEINRELKKTEP